MISEIKDQHNIIMHTVVGTQQISTVGIIVGQCRRRWPNIELSLVHRLVFVKNSKYKYTYKLENSRNLSKTVIYVYYLTICIILCYISIDILHVT